MRVQTFPRSLPSFALLTLVAIVVVDRLLAGGSPGWVVGVVLAAGALLVLARHPHLRHEPWGAGLLLGVLPVAASCALDQGVLAPLLGAELLLAAAWWGRGARYQGALRWAAALVRMPLALLAQVRADRRLVRAWRLIHGLRMPGAGVLVWLAPLVMGAAFVGLFGIANPVIGQWFTDLGEWLASWLDPERLVPSPGRVLLWWCAGCGAWALLRLHAPRLRPQRQAIPAPETDRSALVLRCLVVFNLVFALQVGLDLAYLVGGLRLPAGMSHASYAHRGAYPLLVAALVSAAMVLATFRPGGAAERSSWARRLVLLWLAQNVALTLAAGWRLWLYVDAYGLSDWRLAAAIWMGLVALGLGLIGVRIALGRGNRWLIDANALATLLTLIGCCWLDVGGTVAWHNVRHCREVVGEGVAIDLDYLRGFGVETAPALAWLASHSRDACIAHEARALADHQRVQAQAQLGDWRAWTWVRAQAAETPVVAPLAR